jgi:hypothetical protein
MATPIYLLEYSWKIVCWAGQGLLAPGVLSAKELGSTVNR